MTRPVKITLIATATVGFIAALTVLYFYSPTEVGFYPRCPSKLVTGYDCPGCGSLRGLHALLHGDFAAAWNFNPAIFFAIALVAVIALAGLTRNIPVEQPGVPPEPGVPSVQNADGWRCKIAQCLPGWLVRLSRVAARLTDHPAFPITILVGIIAWTVFRNL